MSKELRNIGEALRGLQGPTQSFAAKVISATDESCKVDDNGYTHHNVRLRAAIDANSNKVVLVPRAGSWVMISRIGGSDQFYVSQVSEVERVMMAIQGKYVVKNVATSLKTILNDLVSELKKAVITTPAGPGNFAPTTIAKLEAVNIKINQLFD